jgi:tetratricopeptide (TPR) repeat protein
MRSEQLLNLVFRRLAISEMPKSQRRIDLSIVVPVVTAIVAGLIGFLSSAYVGYLTNRGSLDIEHEKQKAQLDLENQKFKTNLIIEAVKTGDRKKALDNLTFFIDAGFLDDPGGKIKRLLARDVLPVLPTYQEVEKLRKEFGIGAEAMSTLIGIIQEADIPPEQMRDKLREVVLQYKKMVTQLSALAPDGRPEERNALLNAVNLGKLDEAEAILEKRYSEAKQKSESATKELIEAGIQAGDSFFAAKNYQEAVRMYEGGLVQSDRMGFSDRSIVLQQKVKEAKDKLIKPN